MKIIDKFLKKIKASRNTFATYILTLISVYIVVDRIVEMLFMIFTGVSVSYWGPFKYTLALACPIFAYLFSPSSEFASSKSMKVTLFFTYVTTLYIVAISMFTQWLNSAAWLLLISLPGYIELVTDFSELIRPAFTALAIYLPLTTFYGVIKFIKLGVMDSRDQTRSIWDYKGISLADTKSGHGPFTCDMHMCNNFESGKKMMFTEKSRYQSLFVCGGSGTGKTSLVLEPMMAKDIEKKAFYISNAKEMGYTALKTGIATLNKPYDNEYLNENFNLNMLTPVVGKESVYKAYMAKMLLSSGSEFTYRNLGITSISPDFESTSRIIDICKNYHIKYNLIDPSSTESIGLNPFVYDDVNKIAITISFVLKGMYINTHPEIKEAYKEDIIIQAIENITIMLKEMYPRLNGGDIPNLEDLLKMLTNFDLVQKMCEVMSSDEELSGKYSMQISYFKKYFYKDSIGREEVEKCIYLAAAQLDNLLRLPGVKAILCNRHNNIDFDKALKNGEVTLVCTRRGDLGRKSHRTFGLFFILSMQNAVLRRPGNENSRIPHFFYIDEYPDFICKDTEAIFTLYRKYKVATVISAQNLAQLEAASPNYFKYKETILSNCASKIFMGDGVPEELAWWEKELTERRAWKYGISMDMKKLEYDAKWSGVKYDWEKYFSAGKLATLAFKRGAVKLKLENGKFDVGEGVFNFISAKHKEEQQVKKYNFSKFTSGVTIEDDTKKSSKHKFDYKNINFEDENDEMNPVQTDTTDSTFQFENENAIVVNFKKKK